MESLQLAQMLADLSDLNAAQEPEAAMALVNANKTLTRPALAARPATTTPTGDSAEHNALKAPEQRHHQRVATSSAVGSRTASPARFDALSRRLLTPPMTRSNSTQGSGPGTPRRESDTEGDIDRASTLMALYEIRAKLKQQDNTGMMKAREKIAALAAKQQAQMHAAEKNHGSQPRHTQYTYPRPS